MTDKVKTRLEKNAVGDWYTTGACMARGAPEAEAPMLFSELTDQDLETYFIRQPTTAEEVADACRAAQTCCVSAVRYGGRDTTIIALLGVDREELECRVGVRDKKTAPDSLSGAVSKLGVLLGAFAIHTARRVVSLPICSEKYSDTHDLFR